MRSFRSSVALCFQRRNEQKDRKRQPVGSIMVVVVVIMKAFVKLLFLGLFVPLMLDREYEYKPTASYPFFNAAAFYFSPSPFFSLLRRVFPSSHQRVVVLSYFLDKSKAIRNTWYFGVLQRIVVLALSRRIQITLFLWKKVRCSN